MPKPPDGRHLRGPRNKAKLIEAALTIIEQGNWRPDVNDIATAAGLSLRTFFTHFQSVDNFYAELLATYEATLLNLAQGYSLGVTVEVMLRGRVPT